MIFKNIVLVFLCFSLFCSCGQGFKTSLKKKLQASDSSDQNMYVLVYDSNNEIIKLWKNGQLSVVESSAEFAMAYGLAVSNGDVYISGEYSNGSKIVAAIWKNGTSSILSSGIQNASAYGVHVEGNDVFAWGYESNGTYNVAKYWKNGVAYTLGDGTQHSVIRKMKIDNGNIYFLGEDGKKVVYWKNGIKFNVSSGTNNGSADSFLISGTDIYIAGGETNSNGNRTSKIWKNGVETLTSPSSLEGGNSLIAMHDSDIYALIEYHDPLGGLDGPGIWKNGFIISSVTNEAFGTSQDANNFKDFFFRNSKTYAVGSEYHNSTSVATIWIDGTPTYLTDGTDHCFAQAIAFD